MTYEEATQGGVMVSRKAALDEVNRHKQLWCDFINEVGNKEEYTAREVLDWLGY